MTALVDLVALIGYSGGRVERHLDYGLAGAVLAELARAGRVGVVDGYVAVRSPAPTGDPLSDSVLRRIGEDRKGRDPRAWVVRLGGDVRPVVLDRLVQSGLLRPSAGRILGVLPVDRYVLVEAPDVGVACRRMRAAVTGPACVDPATAALCGLVGALGWGGRCLPDLPRRQVDDRLAEIGRLVWPAEVVRGLVNEDRAGPWGPTVAGIMSNLDEYGRPPS